MSSAFKIDAVLFAKMLQFPVVTDEGQKYRDYLINVVAELDRPAVAVQAEPPKQEQRAPGRPVKYGHPAYTEEEFKEIRDSILVDLNECPSYYISKSRKRAKGLAKEQPEDETIFVLDNGVELHYMGRANETTYPPTIIGGQD